MVIEHRRRVPRVSGDRGACQNGLSSEPRVDFFSIVDWISFPPQPFSPSSTGLVSPPSLAEEIRRKQRVNAMRKSLPSGLGPGPQVDEFQRWGDIQYEFGCLHPHENRSETTSPAIAGSGRPLMIKKPFLTDFALVVTPAGGKSKFCGTASKKTFLTSSNTGELKTFFIFSMQEIAHFGTTCKPSTQFRVSSFYGSCFSPAYISEIPTELRYNCGAP